MNNEHSNLNLDCMANMSSEENELFDQSETIGNVDNVTETKKTDNVHIPVPSSVEGTGKPKPVVIKIPENAPYAAMQATGASTPQIMMPCLPSSLSAQTLFDLALTVEAPDPARQDPQEESRLFHVLRYRRGADALFQQFLPGG